jgi:N-acetylneuraminic acid mutarotase
MSEAAFTESSLHPARSDCSSRRECGRSVGVSTVRRALLVVSVMATTTAAQGRLQPAGSLLEARAQHTATLLADGRVLVAGGRGRDATDTLGSTELFDPKTNGWRRGPPMTTARAGHTATLLDDGRVLVVGGTAPARDGSARLDALDSAEVFEPKTNTWRLVGPLAEARNGHTATKLADGSVLVVGGARPVHQHLASVERFDPSRETFSKAASLSLGRWLHEAVRLGDGSVVVVGGRSNQVATASGPTPRPGLPLDAVERFEPDAGVWAPLPSLTEPRQRTAVVSLGRRVVVFGGQTTTMSTNYVEWWEGPAAEWVQAPTHLSVPIAGHTATALPSGDVLLVGGEPPQAVDTVRVQRWVASSQRWCLAGALRTARKSHAATALKDGTVLVSGGTSAGLAEASTERWMPEKGECVEP